MNSYTDKIRALLDRYYEGATTAEEEQTLAEFFRTAADIPADMEPDRELFRALAAESEAPAELKGKIEAMLESKVKYSKRRVLWISLISSAAAIALIATVTARIATPSAPEQPVYAAVEEPAGAAVSEPFEQVEMLAEPTATASTTATPKRASSAPRRAATAVADASTATYRELTDSDEALEEAAKAISKIRTSLHPVNRACADLRATAEEIDKTLNKILK